MPLRHCAALRIHRESNAVSVVPSQVRVLGIKCLREYLHGVQTNRAKTPTAELGAGLRGYTNPNSK